MAAVNVDSGVAPLLSEVRGPFPSTSICRTCGFGLILTCRFVGAAIAYQRQHAAALVFSLLRERPLLGRRLGAGEGDLGLPSLAGVAALGGSLLGGFGGPLGFPGGPSCLNKHLPPLLHLPFFQNMQGLLILRGCGDGDRVLWRHLSPLLHFPR